MQQFFQSIGGDLINICTFGTEGSKSALKTSARGLDIDDDVVTYLTSMIPNQRGIDWTLNQCYYGDEEHPQIKAFKQEIDKYDNLWELASTIEGLVTRLGVHASGVVAVNGDFTDYNSIMKTSKGQIVSAFELHNSENMGLIKYDFLTVSALDRIHQCFNYLLEDGVIEWQGSLKSTYNKYLHPSILNYTDEKMWEMTGEGKITALFQFDTVVGSQAVRNLAPNNLIQLAMANGAMRLMSDGELPLDRLIRYRNDISEWYTDMENYNLTSEEIKVLENQLLNSYGLAISQEAVMRLVMDKNITNFSMKEANKLRKVIAKKKINEIAAIREMYIEKGLSLNTRIEMLNYVWDEQIKMSLSYSFSDIHGVGYSLIALQEMNLARFYPIIYWNAACLSVDASAINEEDFYNLIDEDILEIEDEEDKRTANKMDYSKVATAIDNFKNTIKIDNPDINDSRLSFTPNAKNNSILYGLKGITRITEPVIQEIFDNRPFNSLDDFLNKITKRIVTKDKVVNLIKCGAFDKIENKERKEILQDFIKTQVDFKKRLTMQNVNMLIDFNLIPDDFLYQKDVYKLTKELRKNRDENKFYYIASQIIPPTDRERASWLNMIMQFDIKELELNGKVCKVIDSNKWDKNFYEVEMDKIRKYIKNNHDELLEKLNNRLFEDEYNKYADGDYAKWELDSINFYKTNHPLQNVQYQLPIEITSMKDVVEQEIEGEFLIKGKVVPRYKIYSIAGTVIDKDKPKGLVTIQTPDAVVTVKIYKDLFAIYNHTISEIDGFGNKIVLEESFFEKGTHLLISGILRGTTFIPKVYKNTGIKAVLKIELDENGNFNRLLEKEQ